MTPKQMADRIAEVDEITRASTQHAANLRRGPAIDNCGCTDPRCTSCRRSAR